MNIEDLMYVRGGKDFSSMILKFMDTIVVKNEQELNMYEDSDSIRSYRKYAKCSNELTTFRDHVYTIDDLPANLKGKSPEELDILNKEGDVETREFIASLRKEFTENYVDKNQYCAMLMGKPVNASQFIFVRNDDTPNLTDEIALHLVNPIDHPNTYTRLYVSGDLRELISTHGEQCQYLKYIGKDISIEMIRESEQFDLLWYDKSILTDSIDIENFLKSYHTVKEFIMKNKYIRNLESMYDHYSNMELLIILMGTFQKICISYLDKYSLRNYTDREIYDILESHNLKDLKPVSMSVLRNVVENIDNLLAYRGTEEILAKIVDVVSKDKSKELQIKKFDLVKTFKSRSEIDPSKPYDESFDLAFIGREVASTFKDRDTFEEPVAYTDIVLKDPSWGANGLYNTESGKLFAVNKVRDKILKMQFNKLNTKYLGVVGRLNLNEIYDRMIHKIGLIIQYYGGFSKIPDNSGYFEDMPVSLLDLFSSAYYVLRNLDKRQDDTIPVSDVNSIDARCWTYLNVMKLNMIPVKDTIQILKNLTFMPYLSDYTVFVGDFLTDAEIGKYVYSFNDISNTFSSIVNQFDDAYNKFTDLGVRSTESDEYMQAMSWKTIYDWFRVTATAEADYAGFTVFPNFLSTKNPQFFGEIDKRIRTAAPTVAGGLEIEALGKSLIDTFKDVISPIIGEENIGTDTNIVENYSRDLNLLIKAFVSIYVELREINIYIDLSDTPYNRTQVMDRYDFEFFTSYEDLVMLSHDFSIFEFDVFKDYIELNESIRSDDTSDVNLFIDVNDEYSFEYRSEEQLLVEIVDDYNEVQSNYHPEKLTLTDEFSIEDYIP